MFSAEFLQMLLFVAFQYCTFCQIFTFYAQLMYVEKNMNNEYANNVIWRGHQNSRNSLKICYYFHLYDLCM